jgi:hypothetical protein
LGMKNKFIHGGAWQYMRGKESALRKSIRARYAAELATAGPFQKVLIRGRMWRDFLRERKQGHDPSPASLY